MQIQGQTDENQQALLQEGIAFPFITYGR